MTGGISGAGAGAGLPERGEAVEVFGMRSRPELNGLVCQVMDPELDSLGCVTVRVRGESGGGVRRKHMRIHSCRLRPVEEASALSIPSFMTPPSAAAAPPARGSQVSGAGALPRIVPPSRARSAASLLPATEPPVATAPGSAAHRSTPPFGSSVSGAMSRTSSAMASSILRMRVSSLPAGSGLEEKKQLFIDQQTAWQRGSVPLLAKEKGVRYHRPLPSTDATQFESDFCKCTGGVPLYKAYPKEEAVLKDARTGVLAAPWAP